MCLVMIPNTEADTGISKSGGVGCHGYGYFILKLFVAGQRYMDKNPSRQNAGGQNTSQNCRGGQNAGHFMGQEGQNANLIKTFIISY